MHPPPGTAPLCVPRPGTCTPLQVTPLSSAACPPLPAPPYPSQLLRFCQIQVLGGEAEELEDSERGVGDSSPGVGRYRIRLAKPERRGSLNRRSEDSASSASFPWFSPLFCLHGTQHQPRGALNQGSSWLGRRVPALRRKRWRWRGVRRSDEAQKHRRCASEPAARRHSAVSSTTSMSERGRMG